MTSDPNAIAASLRDVEPPAATPEDVALGEAALAGLSSSEGSPLWQELCLRLGGFYLELPSGDLAANLDRALALYGSVLATEPGYEAFVAAANGLANAVRLHPKLDRAAYETALQLLERLLPVVEEQGGSADLATVLHTYASALAARPYGDREEAFARALEAAKRAVDVLAADRTAAGSVAMGKALYNLGALTLQQPGGIKSQNVDDAVKAFRQALEFRTVDADPAGRAQTLRALALALPEWTGADSLAHAEALAEEARREAERITTHVATGAARAQGWAAFGGERSALDADLDMLEGAEAGAVEQFLSDALADHRAALEAIPAASMPVDWASWMGGQARLLAGYYLYLGRPETLPEAYACFEAAIAAVNADRDPRLWRDLHRRLGEAAHAAEDWERSLHAHAAALGASDSLYEASTSPEARSRELREARGFALVGAYAAARAGDREEAVRLAELGRSRTLVEALVAEDIALQAKSPETRDEVRAARDRVLRLEAQLRAEGSDPLDRMRGNLADYAGADPDAFGMRRIGDRMPEEIAAADARARLHEPLREARDDLRQALEKAIRETPTVLPPTLSAADVGEIAEAVGHPIVYLIPSMHGCMALSVAPAGPVRTMHITGLTSAHLSTLLHGNEEFAGFAQGAYFSDTDALAEALPVCVEVLEGLLGPITKWVASQGYSEAALVPLGSLGVLPLHAAAAGGGCVYRQIPNARVLARGLAARGGKARDGLRFYAVADPPREDFPPLPFAVAEAKAVARLFAARGGASDVVREAESDSLVAAGASATHLHLACHARFRPSDPLASVIYLGSSTELTLADLATRDTALPGVELIVLSACQTALSDRHLVDESIGFPSALLVAGAPAVVSTTWPVADEVAPFFAYRLYHELFAGSDVATATRAAQLWLRDVTGAELSHVIRELRASLAVDDADADARLADLADECEVRPDARPFSAPEAWAAFAYQGV